MRRCHSDCQSKLEGSGALSLRLFSSLYCLLEQINDGDRGVETKLLSSQSQIVLFLSTKLYIYTAALRGHKLTVGTKC